MSPLGVFLEKKKVYKACDKFVKLGQTEESRHLRNRVFLKKKSPELIGYYLFPVDSSSAAKQLVLNK